MQTVLTIFHSIMLCVGLILLDINSKLGHCLCLLSNVAWCYVESTIRISICPQKRESFITIERQILRFSGHHGF